MVGLGGGSHTAQRERSSHGQGVGVSQYLILRYRTTCALLMSEGSASWFLAPGSGELAGIGQLCACSLDIPKKACVHATMWPSIHAEKLGLGQFRLLCEGCEKLYAQCLLFHERQSFSVMSTILECTLYE